ncbi:hypothetical protein PGH07_10160 [Sulfurovum sp. zt1-1]|uniref:Uncharacterized protein n=1 Tax=Sulfurovum zhangzhouensis TaxID=3019067 RepID=A0ABT7R0B8_9BACT|nr:hypothetical protein [Sulfurovum zhangzhouensis]MDM5272539.1 hypothetical protein [Sulfurovum zhangzhouensis]
MKAKKWVLVFFLFSFSILLLIGGINYIVDPYSTRNTDLVNTKKVQAYQNERLIKIIKVGQIKPRSIILGTSRAEFGYDPGHDYFVKPSYNMAIGGGSMYEIEHNLVWAIEQGRLEQVLLVIDYAMLTAMKQKLVPEFDQLFTFQYIYGYLFSYSTLKRSIEILLGIDIDSSMYCEDGQMDDRFNQKLLTERGGHLAVMNKDESIYYQHTSKNYTYIDTGKNSFSDFEKFINLCYENNIKLDIVFGPSHIRQWEALDYYVGYDRWLQWKKDIVRSVNTISKRYHQPPYRVIDFSVYHPLTAEEVPSDPTKNMKYHWEGSHYKKALGLIVLDRLTGTSPYKDFGVALTINNIDQHLREQAIKRLQYIDTEVYRRNLKRIIESNKK